MNHLLGKLLFSKIYIYIYASLILFKLKLCNKTILKIANLQCFDLDMVHLDYFGFSLET